MNPVFTARNVARICALAFLEGLPLGIAVGGLLGAKGLRQDQSGWFWLPGLGALVAVPLLASIPAVRTFYWQLCKSLVGEPILPDEAERHVAERRWLIVWLATVLATAIAAVLSFGAVLSLSSALAGSLGVSNGTMRTTVVALWVTVCFPLLFVGTRLAELAAYWMHLRTQHWRDA